MKAFFDCHLAALYQEKLSKPYSPWRHVSWLALFEQYRLLVDKGTVQGNSIPLCASTQSILPKLLVSRCLFGFPTYRGVPCKVKDRTGADFLLRVLCRGDLMDGAIQTPLFSVVTICPEVDLLGLQTPRQPLHLVGESETRTSLTSCSVRCRLPAQTIPLGKYIQGKEIFRVSSSTTLSDLLPQTADATEKVRQSSEKNWREIRQPFSGAVFKSRSPSCGVGDARLYEEKLVDDVSFADRSLYRKTNGFFTQLFLENQSKHMPTLHSSPFPVTTEKMLSSFSPNTRKETSLLCFLEQVLDCHLRQKK